MTNRNAFFVFIVFAKHTKRNAEMKRREKMFFLSINVYLFPIFLHSIRYSIMTYTEKSNDKMFPIIIFSVVIRMKKIDFITGLAKVVGIKSIISFEKFLEINSASVKSNFSKQCLSTENIIFYLIINNNNNFWIIFNSEELK